MKAFQLLPIIALLICHPNGLSGQTQFQVAFWNVENLFDTLDNASTADEDFTPAGKYEWTEERLTKKCQNLSQVIHGMNAQNDLAILGLAEIENFEVLNRLNQQFIKLGWSVVHKESPDERGIDCGLLYNPNLLSLVNKQFLTIYLAGDEKTRDIIEAEFRLQDDPSKHSIYVFVNHWPSRWGGQAVTEPLRRVAAATLRTRVDQLLVKDSQADIIILGDFNDYPDDPSLNEVLRAHQMGPNAYPGDLINTTWKLDADPNAGTVMYRGKWTVLDQIIISPGMTDKQYYRWGFDSTHPFTPDYIFEKEGEYSGWPFRSFRGTQYSGGFSDHLPIVCTVNFSNIKKI